MTKTDIKKLFVAIEKRDHEMVLVILAKDKEALEIVGQHNAKCRDKTPLMYAMQCEDFELAQKLMDMGANVNAKMPAGPQSSVLQLAVKFGHGLNPNFDKWLGFTKTLIEQGANPSEALWSACHAYSKVADKPELISLLIKNGASLESEVGNTGSTVKELVEVNSQLYSSRVLSLFGL
jgi:ankyrin repeat protein